MHLIGLCPNERVARTFHDYLKNNGVKCQLNITAAGVEVLVADDTDTGRVKAAFEEFARQPFHPKFTRASWEVGDTKQQFDYGSSGKPIIRQFMSQSGPLSLAVFSICVTIFGLMYLGFGRQLYDALSFYGATPHDNPGQVWRLITPIFIHFSLSHILSNLLWWWYFGGKVEQRIGKTPLLTLLIAGGILPNLVQYWLSGPNFGGLSGVVYALLAYVWVVSRKRPGYGIVMPPALIVISVAWIVLGFSGLLPLPIGNGAHLAGFVVGLIQGLADCRRKPENSETD